MTARYIVGDTRAVLAALEPASVDLVLTRKVARPRSQSQNAADLEIPAMATSPDNPGCPR